MLSPDAVAEANRLAYGQGFRRGVAWGVLAGVVVAIAVLLGGG